MHSFVRSIVGSLAIVTALVIALATQTRAEEPHWDYFSHGGPTHWGDEFPACNLPGESPVNIAGVTPRSGLATDYKPTALAVFNNGHTIQVAHERGSWLTVDGKRNELLQFHVHSPSEHTRDGRATPLEIHFVHRAADGELAVLGVWLDEGAPNAAFEQILGQMPLAPGNSASLRTLDARELLPADRSFYAYDGSLTTPPCTGGVKWYVLNGTSTASAAQIAAFRALEFMSHDDRFVGNARPVQSLDGRLGDTSGARIRAPSTGDGGLIAE